MRKAFFRSLLVCGIATIAVLAKSIVANAAEPRPVAIQFINHAPDVVGLWDETIRSEFIEAMNIVADNVSSRWLHSRPVIVSSDIRSRWRLILVNHRLTFNGQPAAGYHWRDGTGPYAILALNRASDSVAQVFLDGSHELAEMLVDPWANRAINGWYAEVADAVVCCHYDVTLSDGGVAPLSDFVLPHWFVIESSGPFDFINSPYIQHPLEVGPDGFKQRR